MTETGWAVTIEADTVDEYNVDDLDVIVDVLDTYSAIVTGPTDALPRRFGVTLSVDTPADRAIGEAVHHVFEAAAKAGLPSFEIVHIEAMTYGEQDRMLDAPDELELVGVTEIAQILGVSRQRASELRRRPGFPRPLADLASGPVWSRPTLDRFIDVWERKVGRPKADATQS